MSLHVLLFTAGILIALLHPLTLDAQTIRPAIDADRLSPQQAVDIDGRLDESFWHQIDPITNFRQQEPVEGDTPSEQTEVYVAYDRNNLYIGARMFDSEPDKIIGYQRRRDASLNTDDRFIWILDTFNDQRNAYLFEVNPSGLKGDGLITVGQGTDINKAWDGIWEAEVRRDSLGWTVEAQIPFRTLNFNTENSTWGINFQRTIRRKSEEIVWSGHQRNEGVFRPQNAGRLTGLTDLSQGMGLEVTPFGTVSSSQNRASANPARDNHLDAGFDFSYSITPGLRSAITVNTDFAETEVDEREVNLSRFPISFPEQRDFFLEGSSVFSFAPSSGVQPFFSRRIGLIEGEPIPLQAGAKLTGREGKNSVGFYQIRTAETDTLPGEDFTVGRIKRDLFKESSVGLIYTRRDARNDDRLDARQTLGADLELNTSSFLGSYHLQFQSFFIWHSPNQLNSQRSIWDRTARGLRLNFPNDPWSAHVSYRELDDAFAPATGFTPRNGFRRFQPTISYTPLIDRSRIIRELDFSYRYEYLMDMDFRPETISSTITPLSVRFETSDEFNTAVQRNYERLTFPFDIKGDGSIVIDPGEYLTHEFEIEMETAGYRQLSGELEFGYGSFWSGTRKRYETELSVKPVPGLNLSADWLHSRIRLPEGEFNTHLLRFRSEVDLTPDLSYTNNVQYDNLTEIVGFYNRLRWIIQPGTDLYLVYSYNWERRMDQAGDHYRLQPVESKGALKLTYTHRF